MQNSETDNINNQEDVSKIIFFGHHKCASRFFRFTLMAEFAKLNNYRWTQYDVINKPFHFSTLHDLDLQNIDWHLLQDDQPVIVNVLNSGTPVMNTIYRHATKGFRGIHVTRDPRQLLISAYFHHLEGHPTETEIWVWDKLIEDRKILQTLNREDGVLYELDNISKDIFDNQFFCWKKDDRILEVELDDFNRDIEKSIANIGSFLGLSKLPEIEVNDNSKRANSASCKWQEVFTPKIKDIFKERYGKYLIDMGYETGFNW